MSAQQLAHVYVTFVEPTLKVVTFLIIVVFVLYIFNTMRDGKKKTELINNIVNGCVKVLTVSFSYAGLALLASAKFLFRLATLVVAAIRDFFTSKI